MLKKLASLFGVFSLVLVGLVVAPVSTQALADDEPGTHIYIDNNDKTNYFDAAHSGVGREIMSDAEVAWFDNATKDQKFKLYCRYFITKTDGTTVLTENIFNSWKGIAKAKAFCLYSMRDNVWDFTLSDFGYWSYGLTPNSGNTAIGGTKYFGTYWSKTVIDGQAVKEGRRVGVPEISAKGGGKITKLIFFAKDYPVAPEDFQNTIGLNQLIGQNAPPWPTHSYIWSMFPTVTGTIHYVNDYDYRKAENISSLGEALPKRNAGKPAAGNGARDAIGDLESVAKPYVTVGMYQIDPSDKTMVNKYQTSTLLKPEGDDKDLQDPQKFEVDPVNHAFTPVKVGSLIDGNKRINTLTQQASWPVDESKPRKTFDQVKENIPGYIYVDNDIDQPGSGNEWLTPSFAADGKTLVYAKHYYLTYRPYPVPVEIEKVDAKDSSKKLEGAKFDLYYVAPDGDKTKEVLALKDLVTDKDGTISFAKTARDYDALKALLTNKDLKADASNHVFTIGQDHYLMPGKYVLKETEAPEGYKTAVDTTIEVKPNTDGKTQVFTVKDEKKPAPKPTKTPMPTPTPTVTPKLPDTGVDGTGYSVAILVALTSLLAGARLINRRH